MTETEKADYIHLYSENLDGFLLQVPVDEPIWKAHLFIKKMNEIFEVPKPVSFWERMKQSITEAIKRSSR